MHVSSNLSFSNKEQMLFIALHPSFSHLIIYHRVQVEIHHYTIRISTFTRLMLHLHLRILDGIPNTHKFPIQHEL